MSGAMSTQPPYGWRPDTPYNPNQHVRWALDEAVRAMDGEITWNPSTGGHDSGAVIVSSPVEREAATSGAPTPVPPVEVGGLAAFLLARIAEDEAVARKGWARHCGLVSALTRADEGGVISWPSRVLAECEAKRQIIEAYGGPDWHTTTTTLRALATVYADHPDYRVAVTSRSTSTPSPTRPPHPRNREREER